MRSGRKILAWLLVSGGLLLLILGSRELLEAWLFQRETEIQILPPPPRPQSSKSRTKPRFQEGDFIGRMTIPRLDVDLHVVEGLGKKELRRAPGHMVGTGFPGEPDNTIIAAHRDTHFRPLKDIRVGDDILLQFDGDYLLYRVRETEIVTPDNVAVLQPSDTAKLTLITCYPFYYLGSAPKRFIVKADLANRLTLDVPQSAPASAGMAARLTP